MTPSVGRQLLILGQTLILISGSWVQKILLVIEYPSVKKEKIIKSLLEKLGESSQRCHVSIFKKTGCLITFDHSHKKGVWKWGRYMLML